MNATVINSRGVISPTAPVPMPPTPAGPVSMPDLRVEEDVFGRVQLVDGRGRWGVCASREVAERTRAFFGGSS